MKNVVKALLVMAMGAVSAQNAPVQDAGTEAPVSADAKAKADMPAPVAAEVPAPTQAVPEACSTGSCATEAVEGNDDKELEKFLKMLEEESKKSEVEKPAEAAK